MTPGEPLLGWRIWRLRSDADRGLVEPLLESCVYGDPWEPQRTFAAECPEHTRPTPSCGCGIYAVTTREAALEWARWAQSALTHPIVIGQVQLWGRVLPHTAGYRAQLAYPYELEVLPGEDLPEEEARRLERALRDAYL
ncbi:MAG: hypothetical protein ACRDNR_14550, partial [Gaiellaceae bacterium]